tara:strand:+ start:618 stop:1253 length:636 start_codon:yes stop_codon:yes gene_type:complete
MINNPKIGIINHNFANLHSVKKALDYLNCSNKIINKPDDISHEIDAIILPGVGAFDAAIGSLQKSNFIKPIKDAVNLGTPILGVCLGMQLLFTNSEEGKLKGLDLIKGKVTEIKKKNKDMKIPHMGWNSITIKSNSTLFNNIKGKEYFYFVHSYKCEPEDKSIITTSVSYGDEICSSIEYENIFATQFHPEKSGEIGLEIYKNFILKASKK